MRIALIGLPQAGKKTLFQLLTGRAIPPGRKSEEAIEGTASIRDPRVDALSAICRPQRKVYAENRFVLCPDVDARTTGRAWLDAARKCDLVCLVLRAFASESVYHPAGSVDPQRDRADLETELILADMEIAETRLARLEKERGSRKPAPERELEELTLRRACGALQDGRRLADVAFEPHELAAIQHLGMLTLLPLLCTYNVAESGLSASFGPGAFAVSAQIEAEIAAIDDARERQDYLAAIGLAASGVDRMNAAAYAALGLMSFYTIGEDEVRAWTVRRGAPAPVAAGKIHSDLQRGFIRVEIIKFADLVEAGSERGARESGRLRVRGKDYLMEDGDICHFLFNV